MNENATEMFLSAIRASFGGLVAYVPVAACPLELSPSPSSAEIAEWMNVHIEGVRCAAHHETDQVYGTIDGVDFGIAPEGGWWAME